MDDDFVMEYFSKGIRSSFVSEPLDQLFFGGQGRSTVQIYHEVNLTTLSFQFVSLYCYLVTFQVFSIVGERN